MKYDNYTTVDLIRKIVPFLLTAYMNANYLATSPTKLVTSLHCLDVINKQKERHDLFHYVERKMSKVRINGRLAN